MNLQKTRAPSRLAWYVALVASLALGCGARRPGPRAPTPEPSAVRDPLAEVRNVPAGGRVAFFIGQDSTTLGELHAAVYARSSSLPRPDGVTLYTGFLPVDRHPNDAPDGASHYVGGVEGPPFDESHGEIAFAETLAQYDALGDRVALAVGLYLSDAGWGCNSLPLRALAGEGEAGDVTAWRDTMDRLLTWLRDADRPVMLRIGFEFDGPWNCYDPAAYRAAFRYVKGRIDDLGADRVATVWQAAAYPDAGEGPRYALPADDVALRARYDAWYPGDDVVDWVGLSFFSGARFRDHAFSCPAEDRPWTVPDTSPRRLQDALVQFARDHGKPVMIAESAPQGFDLARGTWSCTSARQDHLEGHRFEDGDAMFDAFFTDFFDWIRAQRDVVRAVAYINAHWQAQSGWACPPEADACPAGYWGDSRLHANPVVLERFGEALRAPPFDPEGATLP